LRNRFPVLIQTRTQFARAGQTRGISCGDGYIDRREAVLVQTKGLSCEALDSIACHRGAEGSRRDTQTQPGMSFMIGVDRQTKKCIGKFFAAPFHITKFGRLV
jgi:hypothetical protein